MLPAPIHSFPPVAEARIIRTYMDESGQFKLAPGEVNGLGMFLIPDHPDALRAVQEEVARIEREATPEERRREEVKGSLLHPSRCRQVLAFVQQMGFRVSIFVGAQLPPSGNKENLLLAGSRLLALARDRGLEDRALPTALALCDIGDHDRFYCNCAYSLVRRGDLSDARRRGTSSVELVYDRRLHLPHRLVLDFALNSALAEVFELNEEERGLAALLGDSGGLWTIREGTEADRPGLQLIDWLVYPQVYVHRPDADPRRRADCVALCDLYDQYGVAVYPLPSPDDLPPPPTTTLP